MKKVATTKIAIVFTFLSTIAAMVIGHTAQASVPYTFSANTPARAAEVNANFDNLDTRITAVESARCATRGPELDVTHSPVVMSPGVYFQIDGRDVTVMSVAFVEHTSGEKFLLNIPVALTGSTLGGGKINISTSKSTFSDFCSTKTLSGYPFMITSGNETRQIFSSRFEATSSVYTSLALSILVDKTVVVITLDNKSTIEQSVVDQFNYLSKLSHSLMISPAIDRDYIDNFIDYISIVAVQ